MGNGNASIVDKECGALLLLYRGHESVGSEMRLVSDEETNLQGIERKRKE